MAENATPAAPAAPTEAPAGTDTPEATPNAPDEEVLSLISQFDRDELKEYAAIPKEHRKKGLVSAANRRFMEAAEARKASEELTAKANERAQQAEQVLQALVKPGESLRVLQALGYDQQKLYDLAAEILRPLQEEQGLTDEQKRNLQLDREYETKLERNKRLDEEARQREEAEKKRLHQQTVAQWQQKWREDIGKAFSRHKITQDHKDFKPIFDSVRDGMDAMLAAGEQPSVDQIADLVMQARQDIEGYHETRVLSKPAKDLLAKMPPEMKDAIRKELLREAQSALPGNQRTPVSRPTNSAPPKEPERLTLGGLNRMGAERLR